METLLTVVWGLPLFLLPGYAFLCAFRVHDEYDFSEMVAIALGLSIGVIPLVLYLATYLGIPLSFDAVILLLAVAGVVVVRDVVRRLRRWRRHAAPQFPLGYVVLGVLTLSTLGARLLMVRGITYPLWTDSYHHTIITQLIADTGMIPSSYHPYSAIDQFTYHFGFHAIAAWFHWLTGISVPRSTVIVGQIINALVVPTTYVAAKRLLKRRDAGLVAAAVVGLVSHMPALFVNWGRYTQLSGQILIPVLMVLLGDVVDRPQKPWPHWAIVAVGGAALFLVHIRVFLFFCLYAGLLVLCRLVQLARRRDWQHTRTFITKLAVVGLLGLVVLLPWALRFVRGFGTLVVDEVSEGYQALDEEYFRWNWTYFRDYGLRMDLWILVLFGLVWGVRNRARPVFLMVAWMMSILVLANVYLIGIYPLVSNLVISKFTYFPTSLILAYGVTESVQWLRSIVFERWQGFRLPQSLCLLAIVVSVGLGGFYTGALVEPANGFVRPADLDAMAWIRAHTSEDALFYVSTHFWTPIIAHGLDGGYWLPYLAGRETVLPVELYGSDGTPAYIDFVSERAHALLSCETPEEFWSVARKYNVTHVYVGHRETYLEPDFFLLDPEHFQVIYTQQGVWVFELRE